MALVLASSSVYRKALMQRLRLDFKCISPHINEDPKPNEDHKKLVVRLAKEKALTVLSSNQQDICIGSDTMASCDGQIFGKPLNLENAITQIKAMIGKQVMFYTGICVATHSKVLTEMVATTVTFKQNISEHKIKRYCELEEPFYSCGAFKSETSIVTMLDNMTSDDPTAIVGLPLIKLSEMLEDVGLTL